jgi:dUTPase
MPSNEVLGEIQESELGQDGDRQSIVIELLHDDAQPPRRATSGSAGYDLCAYLTGRTVDCSDGQRQWKEAVTSRDDVARVTLPAQAMALIPLGFKARLPNGYEAQIRPRSGEAFRTRQGRSIRIFPTNGG